MNGRQTWGNHLNLQWYFKAGSCLSLLTQEELGNFLRRVPQIPSTRQHSGAGLHRLGEPFGCISSRLHFQCHKISSLKLTMVRIFIPQKLPNATVGAFFFFFLRESVKHFPAYLALVWPVLTLNWESWCNLLQGTCGTHQEWGWLRGLIVWALRPCKSEQLPPSSLY